MHLNEPSHIVCEKMKDVVFVVEATSFEKGCLYLQHREKNMSWTGEVSPIFVTLGSVHDREVAAKLSWVYVNQRRVMFVEPMSELFDHSLLKAWLDKYCAPRYQHGLRDARNTAGEFRECLRAIRESFARVGEPYPFTLE
jgi:hypothetical protein